MCSDIDRRPGETPAEYAQRMGELVDWIAALVQFESGEGVDVDEMIAEARSIVAQARITAIRAPEFLTVADIVLESGIDAADLPERQKARVIRTNDDE